MKVLEDAHGRLNFQKVNALMTSLGHLPLNESDQSFISHLMDFNGDGCVTLADLRLALGVLAQPESALE